MFESISTDLIVTKITYTAVVIIVGGIIAALVHSSIDLLFKRVQQRSSSKRFISKTATLRALVKNVIDVVVFAMAFFIILSHWGVNIWPMLTGAGIIGLALSFGSQTIVKDMMSGFFIIIEDQYNIGDHVRLAEKYEGVVKDVTLRLTVLEGKKDNILYIPNSQITSVTRYPSTE